MEIELGKIIPVLSNVKILINTDNSEFPTGEYLAIFNVPNELTNKYGEKIIVEAVLYVTAKEAGDYKLFSSWIIFKERNKLNGSEEIYSEVSKYPHYIKIKKNPGEWELEKCKGLLYAEQFREKIVVIEPPSEPKQREKLRVELEGVRGKNKSHSGLVNKIGARKIRPWVYYVQGFKIPHIERTVKKYGGKIIY